MKQRGFTLVTLAIVLGILALIASLIWWADSHIETSAGVKRGEANKQALWDKANRDAEAKAKADRIAAEKLAREDQARLEKAEAEARDYEGKWRSARDAARRKGTPLATAVCKPAVAGGPAPVVDSIALRLTWEFVGLHDSAWTGEGGKPVFGDPAGILARAGSPDPATSSPYDLDTLLDVDKANAATCSADRRQLSSLVRLIKKLRAQWDGSNK